jgi:hypothetical protein
MAIILPEDDVPASGEISGSSRLGLPKIPRANNQALAAINAITRILDGKVIDRDGDTLEGAFEFTGEVTLNELVTEVARVVSFVATSANIGAVILNEAEITKAVVANLVATSLEATTLTATTGTIDDLTSSSSNIDALTARTIKGYSSDIELMTSKLIETDSMSSSTASIKDLTATEMFSNKVTGTSAEFDTLLVKNGSFSTGANKVGGIALEYDTATIADPSGEFILSDIINYIPEYLSYTVHIAGAIDCTVQGTVDVLTGDASYVIIEKGSLINTTFTGLGFPTHDGNALYSVQYDEDSSSIYLIGEGAFEAVNEVPYEFTYQACSKPSLPQ